MYRVRYHFIVIGYLINPQFPKKIEIIIHVGPLRLVNFSDLLNINSEM